MPHHSEPSDDFKRFATLREIIDGDTLRCDIDLGWTVSIRDDVRLARCDAPEKNRNPWVPAGRWVTDRLLKMCSQYIDMEKQTKLHSHEFVCGKFGRCVSDVWIGGVNIGEWLVDEKMAWPMDHLGRRMCVRDIDLLTGIPEDVRDQVKHHDV